MSNYMLRELNMNRSVSSFLLVLLPLTGCYRVRRAYSGPDVPPIILAGGDLDLLKARIACDRKALLTPNLSGPLTCKVKDQTISVPGQMTVSERNDVQQILLSASDEHYTKVSNHLLTSRNTLTFGAEVTGITLSSVSAILGDAETKTILSTTSSLVQSTKTAIDKDFFAQQTSSALVNTMDGARDTKKAQIIASEKKSLDNYGFESAMNDALAYDAAGSVASALLKLGSDAGQTKTEGQKKLEAALK